MIDRVLLAEPRGFCAGVEMAIKALTWMVRVFEPPVYCYHQIVHNEWVVAAFEQAGVVFVDDVNTVPEGAILMLSAHGSAPEVVAEAGRRSAVVIDAVCPLVTKVHHEVRRMAEDGFEILYVGHAGHDEAVGTIAVAPGSITLVEPEVGLQGLTPGAGPIALLAQTTLGMHEWADVLDQAKATRPDVATARKSDLCYATTNRQDTVGVLAAKCDVVLVVGSENSSNTQALVRTSRQLGTPAYRVDSAEQIRPEWLESASIIGLTAGASAPDHLVREVIDRLAPSDGVELVSTITEGEYFPLPPQLRSLVTVLQALVEAGVTARRPKVGGRLDHDREWTASEALLVLTS